MREIVIFGAGGLGQLVRDILLEADDFHAVAYLDSDPRKHDRSIDGLPIRGGIESVDALLHEGVTGAIVAVGDNHARVQIAQTLKQRGLRLVSAIHPLASIAPSARLGEHLIVGARAIVCVNASIGPHSVLSTGSIVDHDGALDTGVFLHPAVRLAGGVSVAACATLGIGACVIPYRRVGPTADVEPGSVVIRDVLPGTTVGGAPARRVRRRGARFIAEPLGGVLKPLG